MGILCKVDEKQSFYELKGEWDMRSAYLGDFNGHVGGHIDGCDWVHGGYGIGQRNLEGRMLLEFCLEMELCVSNTWFKREEKSKVTVRMGENETEIDFVLMKKKHRWFIQNVKAIQLPEFQHALVITDIY